MDSFGRADAPATFDLVTAGWMLHDGREVPAQLSGAPRLDPGERFLMPVLSLAEKGWLVLSHRSVMPVDDSGTVSAGDQRSEGENVTSTVDALQGRTVDDVGAVLEATPAHPELADVSPTASPVERMRTVYGEFN